MNNAGLAGLARFRRPLWLLAVALAAAASLALALGLASSAAAHRHSRVPGKATVAAAKTAHWVATWAASPQEATWTNRSGRGFARSTMREIVLASVGGTELRVRFTNVFGSEPLEIGDAAIGIERRGAAIAGATNVPLTFGGRPSVTIPVGAEALSDPVRLKVAAQQRLAVSIYLPVATGPATQHSDAEQTNYVASGDHALDPEASAFTGQANSWFLLDGVDTVTTSRVRGTIVALGDSITDGVGSTVDANARWPNDLARRLRTAPGHTMSVVDEGIGGNRVLTSSIYYGVGALARFDRDVLGRAGVREVILLEGINDISFSHTLGPMTAPHADVTASQLIAGYEQLIAQAHADNLKIFGGTMTPFKGSHNWTPAAEAEREDVNRWIRTAGAFDGVIDFARAVASPTDPEVLNPAYDSGDHLHPNDAGYAAMARAINLNTLLR